MSRPLSLAVLLGSALVAACNGSDKVTTPDDGGGTDTDVTTDPCAAMIASLEPADGATDVALDAVVVATFTEPVGDGEYAILVDGVAGTTVLGEDGTTATFTADAPFAYGTTYTVTASACTSTQAAAFTTIPEEVVTTVDPDTITGSTYGLYFKDLRFTEPPQAVINAAESFGLSTDFYVLVGIQSYDPVTSSLVAAATTGELDEMGVMVPACDAALGGIVADFTQNPTFSVGPTDFSIPFDDGDEMTVEDFGLTATITPDGDTIEDVSFTGALDMRPTGQKCSLAAALGGTCIPCNDGKKECLVLDATADEAERVDGLDLTLECGL